MAGPAESTQLLCPRDAASACYELYRVLLLFNTLSFTVVKYLLARVLVVAVAASSKGWACSRQSALV